MRSSHIGVDHVLASLLARSSLSRRQLTIGTLRMQPAGEVDVERLVELNAEHCRLAHPDCVSRIFSVIPLHERVNANSSGGMKIRRTL